MNSASRFVVGLDLGTTNCALSAVDTKSLTEEAAPAPVPAPVIETIPIAQLVKAGELGEEPLLPSFVYLPGAGEFAPEQLALPWSKGAGPGPRHAVGRFARDHGSQVPTRLISSAKSWLCHGGVDRKAAILPWLAETDFPKLSPVEASQKILEHLRDAWNARTAQRDKSARLENQEVILTVPASFDAVARELTLEAARAAGLANVILFEEPQAAFYAWLHAAGDQWRAAMRPGDVALVIDVGGGTTDFTLIGVGEEAGELTLDRLAVGDHLLLGGDNMDLALAHELAQALRDQGTRLDSAQMLALWHGARQAKEQLFADPKLTSRPVTLLGRGRKVVGGAVRTELERAVVERVLVDGFFPRCELGDSPAASRKLGLQELGLAYAADPAVTKHLSEFVGRHAEIITQYRSRGKRGAGADAVPTHLPNAVLFNGGVFQAGVLRQRVLEVIGDWVGGRAGIRELTSSHLDRAVAHGAAYYGMVRRGRGIRIRGGVARSYYIGIETAMPAVPGFAPPIKALCVVPQGMEEGTEAELPGREFGLVVGTPAVFRFLGSSQRRGDAVGAVVPDWEETIEELAPLEATLDPGATTEKLVPVHLHSRVTELGTLELWCQKRGGTEKWKLEFNVRQQGE